MGAQQRLLTRETRIEDAGYSKAQDRIVCVTSRQPYVVDQTGLAEENGQ